MSSSNNKRRKVDDPTNQQPSLLQLPWSDFSQGNANNNNENPADSLLLLQLPPNLPLATFLQATSTPTNAAAQKDSQCARIMIRDNTSECDAVDTAFNHPCTLVLPQLNRTLALVRVETSNTYVLVPPQPGSSSSSPCVPMQSRLLRQQDTFVIESMDITHQLSNTVAGKLQLTQYLKQFIFPRIKTGCTLYQLIQQFPFSQQEIKQALFQIHAFTFPHDDEDDDDDDASTQTTFGWIQEQDFYWTVQAILYALNDCDSTTAATKTTTTTTTSQNDSTHGIHVSTFIPQAAQHLQSLLVPTNSLSTQESHALIHHVLLHYLKEEDSSSSTTTTTTPLLHEEQDEKGNWRLNIHKVAILVAKVLFLEQASWEKEDFVQKWHSRMPGVGSFYQPELEILSGLVTEKTLQDKVCLVYNRTTTTTTTTPQETLSM